MEWAPAPKKRLPSEWAPVPKKRLPSKTEAGNFGYSPSPAGKPRFRRFRNLPPHLSEPKICRAKPSWIRAAPGSFPTPAKKW